MRQKRVQNAPDGTYLIRKTSPHIFVGLTLTDTQLAMSRHILPDLDKYLIDLNIFFAPLRLNVNTISNNVSYSTN